MNTSKSLDYFGNKKFKKDWDELDHILAARHYKRKAEVRAEILAWHKAELAKERQAIVEAVEGIYGDSDGLREFAGLNLIKPVPKVPSKRKEQ